MELYPAIDLRAGSAVRLTQGDFDREQQYGDPIVLAARFIAAATPWIHVVDLDAARTGVPHQREVLGWIVEMAAASGTTKVQTGGGVRTEGTIEELLALGVSRVVMGTAAIEEPSLAVTWARRWPGSVVVGLDYVVGESGVAEAQSHGWTAGSGRSISGLLDEWAGEPLGGVVATSIARDGMLEGPDLPGMQALLEMTAVPVVASGGVSRLEDLTALAALAADGRGLSGVIVGKAIAEGRFSAGEAMVACAASG
jgi:phosphoribosylformimino-5-aminoimidazole carboxamide ribotide isomerase